MLDKLISLVSELWDYIKFFEIIYSFEKGVLYRFGKDKRILEIGIKFKIPFIDTIHKDVVVTQTINIPAQTLYTNDLKEITVKAVVKYNIEDIRLFQTKIYDRVDALSDTTMIIIKELISLNTFDKIHNIDNEITKKVRVQARKWGIDIENVALTDISKTRSLRLFNENIINN